MFFFLFRWFPGWRLHYFSAQTSLCKNNRDTEKQAQATMLDYVPSGTSNLEEGRLAAPHTGQLNTDTEHHTGKIKTDKTNWTPGGNETGVALDDITRREENVDHLQSQADDAAGVKQCCVQLQRLDTPQSLQLGPVRRNRGLRLKKILLKEKRRLRDHPRPACKPASRKAKSPSRAPREVSENENSIHSSYMAPITNCSEDDSWSYYSDEDSFHKTTRGSPSMADSWSDYLDDSSSFSSVSSPTGYDSFINCSNEEPATMGSKVLSAPSRKLGTDVKASTSKKVHQVYCFLCKKHVDTSKCNHCPKTLPRLRFLILHEWTHTGHLPFQCAQCSCRFKSDADLIYHERVHTKEKPYLCPECGKTFSQNSNLLRHLNLIHDECQKERRHACSQCEKSFKEKGALKKHQRSKHLNELLRHPCSYCGKMISTSTLARHKLIHTGERPFKCTVPECDKFFRSTSEVKKHVLMQHTTERPYKCDVCGKGFIKMCFLKAHAKIHSGEKPFACHICGKAFPKLYSMQRHKKLIHTYIHIHLYHINPA